MRADASRYTERPNERETTVQDALNNWERIDCVRIWSNGYLRYVQSIRQDENGGYIVREFFDGTRWDKTTKYVDRRVYATTKCYVTWRKG